MTERIEIGDGWIDVSDKLHRDVMSHALDEGVTPQEAYKEVLGLDISGAALEEDS